MSRQSKRQSVFSLIASDFRCIRQRDPAARGPIEVAFCYPGLHAIATYRIAHWFWARLGWRFGGRFLSYLGRMLTGVDIHPGARIGPGFFIDHGACVVIGETAEIGSDVTLYHGVTLGGVSWSPGKRHPTLGDRVLIGAGAKVLGPVTIGADVRVGANAVVVSDAPEGATMVGGPARVVQRAKPATRDPLHIDLDHHLMPDPVGKTLARLADRIGFLEARLAEQARQKQQNAALNPAREDDFPCGCAARPISIDPVTARRAHSPLRALSQETQR